MERRWLYAGSYLGIEPQVGSAYVVKSILEWLVQLAAVSVRLVLVQDEVSSNKAVELEPRAVCGVDLFSLEKRSCRSSPIFSLLLSSSWFVYHDVKAT